MKNTYTKERGAYDDWDWDYDDPPDEESADLYKDEDGPSIFHVGSPYDGHPIKQIICRSCGGDKFNVGSEPILTAIRCITCEWEYIIHDG